MKIIVALETQAATDPRIASTIKVIGTGEFSGADIFPLILMFAS